LKALTVVGLILIILGVFLASEIVQLSVVETVYVKVSKTVKTAPAIAFPYYEAYECNPDWSLKYTLFTPIDTRDVVGQLRLQFGLTDVTLDHEDNNWWYYVGTRVFEQPQPTTAPPETTRTTTTSRTTTTTSTTTTIITPTYFGQRNLGIVMALAGLFLVIWGERRR
jgi:hypothetical protein